MKFRVRQSRAEDSAYELNLAPMLALMVTLIPVLLLSVIFMKVVVIDSPIPQIVDKAEEVNKQNKIETVLELEMSKGNGFKLAVKNGSKVNLIKIPNLSNGYDLEKLYLEAYRVKQANPTIFRIEFKPHEGVEYNDIVSVMDKLRSSQSSDKKIRFVDKDGETVETNLMFPDLIFTNVVEG